MSVTLIKRLEWQPELYELELSGQEYPWTQEVLRSCFDDAHYESWGLYAPTLCGFIITHSILDERTIMNLVVDPKCRGRGYGRELVTQVQNVAQAQSQSLWLEVRASNAVAQQLYGNAGFIKVAERAHYYRTAAGSEAAVVMQWRPNTQPD